MYKIKTLNKISKIGLAKFKDNYYISDDISNPDGILVRSEVMHDYIFNDNLLAIARAGAGVNNIPIDRCTKDGIVVFNTPGANANGVKELVICGLMLASRDIIGGAKWISTLTGDIKSQVEKGKSKFAGSEIKGKTLGIVGKTGSGKSTLVRQLVRQLPIDSNTMYLNNNTIDSYHKESVRSIISYVPQEHVLFSRSVYENVKLGKKGATDEEINNAIKLADFEKDLVNLPKGLDTIVGEYGVTLSGGQKQRLAIARAFLRNSDVLILDDSLSAVDGKTEANIIDTLNNYRKDKTNIIVAHRLSAVMQADNIIVLDKGQIVESGNHKQLMKNHGWYYTQFKNQQMNKEEK